MSSLRRKHRDLLDADQLERVRAYERARDRRRRDTRPFLGIDGEGCGQDRKGRQHYMLLCAGNDQERYELFTGKPLRTAQILAWLCDDLPDNEEVTLVGFSFGYDVSMILRDLNSERRRDLLWTDKSYRGDGPRRLEYNSRKQLWEFPRRSTWTYWRNPDNWDEEFGIDYLPGNHLKVCRMQEVVTVSADGIVSVRRESRPETIRTIYETFGFFQCKFAKALTNFKAGTPAERRMIAANKAERAQFHRITKGIREYCMTECILLARMMTTFRVNSLAAGLRPDTWNGPGKIAASLYEGWGTIKAKDLERLPRISGLLGFAEAAYYGGRFECPHIGFLPPGWSYDINSAYPFNMAGLPCFEHGDWEYLSAEQMTRLHRTEPDALYVASVRYNHASAGHRGMCGLPHRHSNQAGSKFFRDHHGSICWPLQGQGTYWSVELRSAETLGARLTFGPGWRYHKRCDCEPFAAVPDLYAERKRLDALYGKNTQGYPIKVTVNSLYGKMAQRIGGAPYHNPVWAGLVTARTRAMLNLAIAQNPEAIAMIATDGIYSTSRLNLPLGDDLGQWSCEPHPDGLFIVQPGLYWSKTVLKTRGISPGWFAPRRRQIPFERAWQRFAKADQAALASHGRIVEIPAVSQRIRLFVGLNLAEARNDPDSAGRWIMDLKTLSFDWRGKRGAHSWHRHKRGAYVSTHPLTGGSDWISATYDADPSINAEFDEAGEELDDQPDYVKLSAQYD